MRDPIPLPLDFDPPPRARETDGGGSHKAAWRVGSDGSARAQAELALQLVHEWPGATSMEMAERWGQRRGLSGARIRELRYILARRLPELRANALVTNGPKRRCRYTDIAALTWWPAELAGALRRTA